MESKKYVAEQFLAHAGKKGMKWGFTFGKPNGKRTAEEMREATIAAFGWGSPQVKTYSQNGQRYTEEHLYETVMSKGLFSGTDRTRTEEHNLSIGKGSTYVTYTHYRDIGIVERTINKAKKFISKLFSKKKPKVNTTGAVSAVKTGKKSRVRGNR